MRAKTTAAAGLEASTISIKIQKEAISELHQKLDHLHHQVQDREGSSSRQSDHMIQHLQQLKLDLLEQVSSQVAKSLANQAADFAQLHHQLKEHTSLIDQKLPLAQSVPAGAHVANHELHHIATEKAVCDKNGASGLNLNITDDLLAPVVVVGHNRPGYMARTIIQLMK
jgi:hypothetical protein